MPLILMWRLVDRLANTLGEESKATARYSGVGAAVRNEKMPAIKIPLALNKVARGVVRNVE